MMTDFRLKHTWVAVDAHVHIHNCFDIKQLITLAHDNFCLNADILGLESTIPKVLCLTESDQTNYFSRLCTLEIPDIIITETSSENCLKVIFPDDKTLFVIAGRQIVTAEKIEVLAVGLKGIFPDGQELKEVIENLSAKKLIAILPWGPGKWFTKRGRIVRNAAHEFVAAPIFLGDNGNRPCIWRLPYIFTKVANHGIRNLPGSDPLPFKREERRVGNYGFAIEGAWDDSDPFNSLRTMVLDSSAPIKTFGASKDIPHFIFQQVIMQIRKYVDGKY